MALDSFVLAGFGWSTALLRMRYRVQVQRLNLRSRPRRFAQELERGIHAGVVGKTSDLDALAESVPSIALDEVLDHRLERDTVERVDFAGLRHADSRLRRNWKRGRS